MLRKRRTISAKRSKPRRSQENQGERRKRNRVILKSLLIAGITIDVVLGVLALYLVFLRMPYFNLHQVDVAGNRRLSREEVIEAAELEGGMNLLTVNLGTVSERLKRHPWIRSASLYRRFPGRIIVEIEERTPRALLAAGKLYYVDSQTELFTRCFPGDPVNYPLLTGVKPEDLKDRGLEVREATRLGLSLLDILERRGHGIGLRNVAEVRLHLDEGLTLITSTGRTIVLGKDKLDVKLRRFGRLKRFLTRRGEWNNARVIDMDFDDRALVRPNKTLAQG